MDHEFLWKSGCKNQGHSFQTILEDEYRHKRTSVLQPYFA